MGKCISKSNSKKGLMILPSLDKKYQKQIRRTKSMIEKKEKNNNRRLTTKGTESFLDFKDFVGFNPNPLITEYK